MRQDVKNFYISDKFDKLNLVAMLNSMEGQTALILLFVLCNSAFFFWKEISFPKDKTKKNYIITSKSVCWHRKWFKQVSDISTFIDQIT